MILSIEIMRKKDELSKEAFLKYLLEEHGQKVKDLPELEAYQQNHVIMTQQFGMPNGGQKMDALSVLSFADHGAMDRCFASEHYRRIVADEKTFVGDLQIVTAEQMYVIPVNTGKKLVKRMSLITRHPGIDFNKFKYEWYVTHAEFVKRMQEVEGYKQNLVLERYYPRGRAANRESVYIDGIVELYFESQNLLNQSFSSENGIRSNWHTRTFLREVTPFLVEEYQIK